MLSLSCEPSLGKDLTNRVANHMVIRNSDGADRFDYQSRMNGRDYRFDPRSLKQSGALPVFHFQAIVCLLVVRSVNGKCTSTMSPESKTIIFGVFGIVP